MEILAREIAETVPLVHVTNLLLDQKLEKLKPELFVINH